MVSVRSGLPAAGVLALLAVVATAQEDECGRDNPRACVDHEWGDAWPIEEHEWAKWWRAWRHANFVNQHKGEEKKIACNDTVFRPGLAGFLLHEYTDDEDNDRPPPGKHWFVFMWGENPSTGGGRTLGSFYDYREYTPNIVIIVLNKSLRLKKNEGLAWDTFQHELSHYGGVGNEKNHKRARELEDCGKRNKKKERDEATGGRSGGVAGGGGGGGGGDSNEEGSDVDAEEEDEEEEEDDEPKEGDADVGDLVVVEWCIDRETGDIVPCKN